MIRQGMNKLMRAFYHKGGESNCTGAGLGQLEIRDVCGFRIAYRRGTADEQVLQDSFPQNQFLNSVPDYQTRPNDVIIDVGAHIGTFSLLAQSKLAGGIVHAIEPCLETYNYLKVNIALNQMQNIRAHRLALSKQRGSTRLYYNAKSGNWGHSITMPLSDHGEEVPTDTLAGFFDTNHIDRCQFMKLNCEGAEFDIILNSSPETLARIETMLVLYHCDRVQGVTERDLEIQLANGGFNTRVINKSALRGWLIATNANISRAG